jgi:hypothetical protein
VKTILLVSVIHICWGLMLILLPHFPRPFGALEPYLLFTSEAWAGTILVTSGVLPIIALRLRWFRCLACATVPQQMVLVWGLGISIVDAFTTIDGRSLVAIGYTAPITLFHAHDMLILFETAFQRWRGGDGAE